jgi:hypothetical protein
MMRFLRLPVLALAVALPAPASEVRHEADRWTIEDARLRVVVTPDQGRIEVTDKSAGVTYRPPDDRGPGFREVAKVDNGLAFLVDFWARGKKAPTRVRLTVAGASGDLHVACDRADRGDPLEMMTTLPPLAIDQPRSVPVLAIADYSDGHLYPLDLDPFPARWSDGGRMDMPWVGVCDLERGAGYDLILDTSEDAVVECKAYKVGDKKLSLPAVSWLGSRGKFAHPRMYRYRFVDRGGYVALAKAYRALAKEQGLLVTLAAKARTNPNVARLFGATDVWGGGPGLAKQAKEAGIDRLLVQGRFSATQIQAINDLGDVSSEYDNYTDVEPVRPGKDVDSNHDLIPDHVVLEARGERMKAWLTYDKKAQFMKRCPAFWVPSAEKVIPKVLAERPFNGRFIDVTTAEGLYECADPAHPLSKLDKRRCGEKLLGYVRSKNLVVGGEHGIWWAVPYADYFEGMMSSNHHFAWPAGHLVRPKNRTEKYAVGVNTWAAYDRHGIGYETRAPLWELVFHDCVISTWYWGDSSDFLLQLDPTNQDRKDAYNVLYGTMPMLWANREGGWNKDRARALRTMKVVGAVHRAIATGEMVSHQFVTPDRAVQRTRWCDKTEIVVNFGKEPTTVLVGGQSHTLPGNGFIAHGPKVHVAYELVDGRPVTNVSEPAAPPH